MDLETAKDRVKKIYEESVTEYPIDSAGTYYDRKAYRARAIGDILLFEQGLSPAARSYLESRLDIERETGD